MDIQQYIKDNIDHYYIDDKIFYSLLHSLDKEQLLQLKKWAMNHYMPTHMLLREIDRILKPEIKKQNESITELIKLFNDKRSRRVQEARKKLVRRFEYQSVVTQRKILKHFLYASSTDRKWALTMLKKEWHKCLLNDVKDVWEKFHDEEGYLVVLKHFPEQYLLEHQNELSDGWRYKYLCLRLANTPNFQIEKERFKTYHNVWDYIYVMASTGLTIDGEEAEQILYKLIADAINKKVSYKGYISCYGTQEGYEYNVSTILIPGISKILLCMGKLKLTDEIIRFREWNVKTQTEYKAKYRIIVQKPFIWECQKSVWDSYLNILHSCFPEKYKYLIKESAEEGIKYERYRLADTHLSTKSGYSNQNNIKKNKKSDDSSNISQEQFNELLSNNVNLQILVDTFDLNLVDKKSNK